MEQPVDAVVRKPKGSRSVVLLKNEDVRRKNNEVYIPNTIEMAQIKKPIRGQYKKNVQFSRNMNEDMVRSQLHEAFPTFDLKNERFSCAAVSQDSITFQFHGTPRVWDGRTIKRLIKGNSVLYIVMGRNQVPQKLQHNVATEDCGISTDICMNPGNNTIRQTNKQTNRMDLHVPLDEEQMLFPEPTALRNTGQTPLAETTKTDMEVDDSQKGNNDELAVYGISAPSVNQFSDTPEDVFSSSTTSGMVSGSDPEFSEENLSFPLPFEDDVNFKVQANPDESPLKGGGPCCCTIDTNLLDGVTSGRAYIGRLGTVDLQRLPDGSLLFYFPAAIVTGSYPLLLESQDGKYLGDTTITYYDERVQKMVHAIALNPCLQRKFFDMCSLYGNNEHTGDETLNSGKFTGPVEMLSLTVYAAAESGTQQLIEMIFTSSAGRAVFDVYKKNQVLPEVIAKDHGNNETAKYLEELTIRFSEEIRAGKECSQTVDWFELVKAAEAAEKQRGITSEKEDDPSQKDIPKETGYLGDIDTSSSESSEAQSSDSDDDISRLSRKEIQAKAEECMQPVWKHGDHGIEAHMASLTQSPILFLKDGAFPRGNAYVKTFYEIEPLKCKENSLHNLQQVQYLQGSGISFLRGLGNEPIQQHLITTYQRLGCLLTLSTERNAYYKMHVDTAEDHQSLKHLSITAGNKDDYRGSRLDALQQLCCRLISGEFTATANREDLTVRWKSAEFLMEHCRSAAPDFWVLTYTFRPTGRTLFVYVADSKDVFPLASCFDDRQYELSWQRQQWQGCKNNVPKVQEIYKLPESNNEKTNEICQHGDVHLKACSRDTEDSAADSYRDRKEAVREFELENILSTSGFMNEQLLSAQTEIPMKNEIERQILGKRLKEKKLLKLERKEPQQRYMKQITDLEERNFDRDFQHRIGFSEKLQENLKQLGRELLEENKERMLKRQEERRKELGRKLLEKNKERMLKRQEENLKQLERELLEENEERMVKIQEERLKQLRRKFLEKNKERMLKRQEEELKQLGRELLEENKELMLKRQEDVKRTKNKLQEPIWFSDLSKAEKQDDNKELVKPNVMAN